MRKFTLFIAALCAVSAMATGGALSGKFSVSATKQVVFSQGNLQYQASTYIWQFAANQYDIVGADNANIADDYSGWIDLFGWGTGDAPTKHTAEYNDYTVFNEWGANAISNGGNATNLWRTLTADEWEYLFRGRTNSETLFGFGSVNGVNGLIILPDDWSLPTGAVFTASTTQGLEWDIDHYENTNNNNMSHNTYTLVQWADMETAGAVFLPAGDGRVGANWWANSARGHYWSSSDSESTTCYGLDFTNQIFSPHDGGLENVIGCSVRLVQDVEEVQTAISQPSTLNSSAQKILRDGQLLITRDGKTFTAQGVEVR